MRKEWTLPVVEEFEINQTAGGGAKPTTHDGVYVEYQGGLWEGFDQEVAASAN